MAVLEVVYFDLTDNVFGKGFNQELLIAESKITITKRAELN